MKKDLYQIADELRAIATTGLAFSDSGYDKERYQQILKASARLVAAVEDCSAEDVLAQYTGNLAHISPVVGVESAVFRDNKILLIQRRDSRLWAMPGGLVEVGESLAQAAERELWEEAGVRGKAVKLLAIMDSRFWPIRSRMQLYIAQFLLQSEDIPAVHAALENEISSHSEVLDVGFFNEAHLPELHFGHDRRVPMAFQLYKGALETPFFDRE